MEFSLDKRLEKDTFLIGDLPLCKVLLMNVTNFVWLILVPRVADIREIFQLNSKQLVDYQKETNFISKALLKLYAADKMNVASLGNLVPQLHTHLIVRHVDDDAWPNPVWTLQSMNKYNEEGSKVEIDKLRKLVDDYIRGDQNERL